MMKKLIQGIGLMAICLFLFPLSVIAADKSVTFSEAENGAQVWLEIPSVEGSNPVTSMQMSFKVEILQGNKDQTEVAFTFSEGLPSMVKEYRYHKDTGILTIYISGKENLLSTEKLALGQLTLSSEDALGVKAKISMIPDSYVYVAEGGHQTETEKISSPGYLEVTVGKGGIENEPPQPSTPGDGDINSPDSGNGAISPENGGNGLIGSDQQGGFLNRISPNTGNVMNPMGCFSALAIIGISLILLKVFYLRKEKQK